MDAGRFLRRNARKLGRAAQNALEVARIGRIGPEHSTPYEILREDRAHRLRRYAAAPGQPAVKEPVILVPALMINSDIYDIDVDASAVGTLAAAGLDVWLVDFGAPEDFEGGAARTQDDHVRAINDAIDLAIETTGHDVHLVGYSQGGMFAYQVAAIRRSAGIKSVITFGALVDLYENLPMVGSEFLSRYLQNVGGAALKLIEQFDVLPSGLISTTFKLISLDKRAAMFTRFVMDLHDRQAIETGEGKRRFLGGEGFVAWPGPALRTFVDEFVVNNRLTQGGFVVDGKAGSLDDITCPILYFMGDRDDIARPRSVRAIRDAAPNAGEMYEVMVPAGHIGLVVSGKAFEISWPTVIDWVRWKAGVGDRPERLEATVERNTIDTAIEDVRDGIELIRDASTGVVARGRDRFEGAARRGFNLVEALRFQVARLAHLENMREGDRVSLGLTLAQQASKNPTGSFFIYAGRGQSYAEADHRVDHVVRGLIACGVRPRQHVGVMMNNRPSYLSLVTALSRLGAVSVLLSPDSERASLEGALRLSPVDVLVADPDNVARARAGFDGQLLMLGAPKGPRPDVEGVVDMEKIDTERVDFPDWYVPNPGRTDDLAMVMFTAGRYDEPRAARITNRRWAVAAYGAAAAATLSARDTVYACTPLHHASGMLVAVGGAMVGGARLAMAAEFDPELFWEEVRRYGVSVVFYAGEMLRQLVDAPSHRGEQDNPVRLFAGSGIRRDIWRRLVDRFGPVGVLEFYATTEGTGVLANVAAEKVGSLGRPLPGSESMFLAAYDFSARRAFRDDAGHFIPAGVDEPAVMLTRVDPTHAQTRFDGFMDEADNASRLRHGVVDDGDTWFVTGDVMRRDVDGDHWFLDRLSDVVYAVDGPVFTRPVEDALYQVPGVQSAVAYAAFRRDGEVPVAAVVLRPGRALDEDELCRVLQDTLEDRSWPRVIRIVEQVPMTDGHRPLKKLLREAADELPATRVLELGQSSGQYAPRAQSPVEQTSPAL